MMEFSENRQSIVKYFEIVTLSVLVDIVHLREPVIHIPKPKKCSLMHEFEEIGTEEPGDQGVEPLLSEFNTSGTNYEGHHVFFTKRRSTRIFACYVRVMKFILDLLYENKHATMRDLYYTNVALFKDQSTVNCVIQNLCILCGDSPRNDLNITASPKGLVYGNITFCEDSTFIDCLSFTSVGKLITPLTEIINTITIGIGVTHILIVEKDAIFARLIEDQFCDHHNCIIITGKGYPDFASRQFLLKLVDHIAQKSMKISVSFLVDCDPFGIDIMLNYLSFLIIHGTEDLKSFLSNNVSWIGLSIAKDFPKFGISNQCLQSLTDLDIKTLVRVKKRFKEMVSFVPFSFYNDVSLEMDLMNQKMQKAEIQSLSCRGVQFITQSYLPYTMGFSISTEL